MSEKVNTYIVDGKVRKKFSKNLFEKYDEPARVAAKQSENILSFIDCSSLIDYDVGEHQYDIDLKAKNKDIYVEVAVRRPWTTGDAPNWSYIDTLERKYKYFKKYKNSYMIHFRKDCKKCAIASAKTILSKAKKVQKYCGNSGAKEWFIRLPIDDWTFLDVV